MSKMFETLYRLERGFSPQADAPEAPASRRTDAAEAAVAVPRVIAAPVRLENPKTAITPRTVEETEGVRMESIGRQLQAKAIDFGILTLALGLLWSVIRLAGCDLRLGTRDLPLVVMSGILLATFYWFLWVLAQRETPGTSLVTCGRLDAQGQLVRAGHSFPPAQPLPSPRPPIAPRALPSRETAVRSGPAEDLSIALRILASERILDARTYVSARSVRDRDRYFLGRWATSGAEVNEYAVGRGPDGEASLHSEIYQANAGVMAVVHWHAPEIAPFGVSTIPMRPVSDTAMFLSNGVPILEWREGQTADNAKESGTPIQNIAAALASTPAVMVRGRGAIVVGQSLKAAISRAYHMTVNAKLQAQTILLGGTVNYLAPGEATDVEPGDIEDREWEIWKQRLPRP